MKNTIATLKMPSKNQKSFPKCWLLFLLSVLIFANSPLKAQNEEIPIITYKTTSMAFKNDSTMNTTEDGWSKWQPFKAYIIVNMEKGLLKVVSNGIKRDYYIFKFDIVDEAIIMKAVDFEGDDLSIKIQRQEDIIQLYLNYEKFALVYAIPAE